jgi:hypothetical protein
MLQGLLQQRLSCPLIGLPVEAHVAQKGTSYASLWALVYVASPMCYSTHHHRSRFMKRIGLQHLDMYMYRDLPPTATQTLPSMLQGR